MEMNITFDDWRDLFLIRKGEEFSETGLKILWKIAQKYVSEDDFIKPEINYIINIVSNSFKEFVLDDLIDKYDSNKKDIFRSFKNNNIEFYYSDGVVIIHQKDLHRLPKFIQKRANDMKKEDLKLLQDISKMPKDNGYVRVDVFLNGYNFKPGAKSIIL